ncbi:tetratricopeptide repeat protein [Cupriavidus pauculus]|uniref:Tetratricopeptide repeat protein n=1 Tax=Cupriavidus pauculus TaxID=82633 RepID=A0A3G8H9V6_9BURK|nr:tetratricopeptide repeat protein [Cupriavidus pauculus]AZG17253.1 tetratricopeptide repeat protein [Cupriavidus pauculus]
MLSYSTGLVYPSTHQDFEDLCHQVYRVVYRDMTASKNGRSGQKQHGVDIFFTSDGQRYGVQCKHKSFGKLTKPIIDAEIGLAEKGPVAIDHLIIATTARNDAKLLAYALELSDRRKAEGKFAVALAFWETIESLVRGHPELQSQLAPHQPGGAFYETSRKLDALLQQVGVTHSWTAGAGAGAQLISAPRTDSLNKLVDGQLEAIKRLIEDGRVRDALESIKGLAASIDDFDVYQKCRWYTQRGHCYWLTGHLELAAQDFEQAFALTPEDDKAVANRIRGLLLTDRVPEAWEIARKAKDQFPGSRSIFIIWAQLSVQVRHPVSWRKDVPPEFKNDADVLYTFGWLAILQDKPNDGLKFVERALKGGRASFEVLSLRLIALVQTALVSGALASVGVVDKKVLDGLRAALEPFREHDTLWARQDSVTTPQTVVAMGYAMLMLDEQQAAAEMLVKAVARFPEDDELLRVSIDALLRSEQRDSAYEFGTAHLDALAIDGKLVVAEMAANRGDEAILERVATLLASLNDVKESSEAQELLTVYRWLCQVNLGKKTEVMPRLSERWTDSTHSFTARTIAVRVAHQLGCVWATRSLERLVDAVSDGAHTAQRFMVAQLCAMFGQHESVIRLLERCLPQGYVSEPHKTLFEAYVRTNARKKALLMLRAMPQHAMDDPNVRSLAVELAQAADDWQELSRLSERQLLEHADRSEAWVFRFNVLWRQGKRDEARALLSSDIRLTVGGNPTSIGQLSQIEISNGQAERGLKRLYRQYRLDAHSEQSASAFLTRLIGLPAGSLPESPVEITGGTAVTLKDADGVERSVIFDPFGIDDLPLLQPFGIPSGQPFALLLGKRVGDTVSIRDTFGGSKQYEVVRLDSCYRALGALAGDVIAKSFTGSSSIVSVPITMGADGIPDMSKILSMLRRRNERAKSVFSVYGEGPIPLGAIAKAMGTSVAVMTSDWPLFAPPLYVCSGRQDEEIGALRSLSQWDGPVVVDLPALNELLSTGAEASLSFFKEVIISSSAVSTLKSLIETASNPQEMGQLQEVDGEISMIEYNESFRAARLGYLRRVEAFIESTCTVVPAWGIENVPSELMKLAEFLDQESYDAMLVCLEHGGLLLTLDGRLREAASVLGNIPGVWPQAVGHYAVDRAILPIDAYHMLVFASLAKRRSHVGINSQNIVWLLRQSEALRRASMKDLLGYLADTRVDLLSVFGVVMESIKAVTIGGGTVGAMATMVRRLFAPLFSRPDADSDGMAAVLCLELTHFVKGLIGTRSGHPFAHEQGKSKRALWIKAIDVAVKAAQKDGKQLQIPTIISNEVDVVPVFGTVGPMYLSANFARTFQDLIHESELKV